MRVKHLPGEHDQEDHGNRVPNVADRVRAWTAANDPLFVMAQVGGADFVGSGRVGAPDDLGVNLYAEVDSDGDRIMVVENGNIGDGSNFGQPVAYGQPDESVILADEQIAKLRRTLPKAIAATESGQDFDKVISGEDNGDLRITSRDGQVHVAAYSWSTASREEDAAEDLEQERRDFRENLDPVEDRAEILGRWPTRDDFDSDSDYERFYGGVQGFDSEADYLTFIAQVPFEPETFEAPDFEPIPAAALTVDMARDLLATVERLATSPPYRDVRTAKAAGNLKHLPGQHDQRTHGRRTGGAVTRRLLARRLARLGVRDGVKPSEAQRRQARIDLARDRAEVLAEIEEVASIGGQDSPASLLRSLSRVITQRDLSDDPHITGLTGALTGGVGDILEAVESAAISLGLSRIGGDPADGDRQLVAFDRAEHENIDDTPLRPGQWAIVARPGYRGEGVVVVRALVGAATPDEIAAGRKHLPGRHDQSSHGRRGVGASVAPAEPAKPSRRRTRPAEAGPSAGMPSRAQTWEEMGEPSGVPPVGQVIGYQGGTYERLPGEPRTYRVVAADGRDISSLIPVARRVDGTVDNQSAEAARGALRLYELDRGRIQADERSQWRRTLAAVPGSFHLDTGEISGFDEASPARRAAILAALRGWKQKLFDTSRGVEPVVNAALRGRAPRTAETEADIAALDDAFTLSRTSRPITVYRGIGDGGHILPGDWQSRDLTGVAWTDAAFTATSVSKNFASHYVGDDESRGFGIRVKLPKGSPAIALPDAVGGLDAEGEIILPRGLTFRVVKDHGTQGRPGRRWLDVEIVGSRDAKAFKHLLGQHDQDSHGHRSGGVRDSLRAAATVAELGAAAQQEAKRLTGRDIPFRLAGSDLDAGQQHAEGVLRGLERFPQAPLRSVGTYGPGGTEKVDDRRLLAAYAAVQHGRYGQPDDTILFNNMWRGDSQTSALAADKDSGWSTTGDRVGVALHEFGHVLSHYTSAGMSAFGRLRKPGVGEKRISKLAREQVSGYAAINLEELVAEAFADVMANGDRASTLSREIFDLVERGYEQRVERETAG